MSARIKLTSIVDKSLSQKGHTCLGMTRLCAIKEESKVVNLDWFGHQACSVSRYINLFKIGKCQQFSLIYTLGLRTTLAQKIPGAPK